LKNWHNFKAYKNMNKKYYLLFALFISVISVFAQKKDENEIKKMTADFEANKTKLELPLINSKVDFKTLYLDENRKPLRGVDIISKDSSNFVSPANGYVTAVFPDEEKYFSVIVCHGDYFIVYSHVEKAFVTSMQNITKGQYIGSAPLDKQGNRRLHIEIWYNSDKLWPPDWFKKS
jgi:murein DD-endopeptidase MepM/ murein hydrolase activator NlpD